MKEIPKELIKRANEWLGVDGRSFFQQCLDDHGTVSPVLDSNDPIIVGDNPPTISIKPLPHPVHLREGMAVRNFMRHSGFCVDWNDHDYDNLWPILIEKVITCKQKEQQENKPNS